jgi:hypothetical protein
VRLFHDDFTIISSGRSVQNEINPCEEAIVTSARSLAGTARGRLEDSEPGLRRHPPRLETWKPQGGCPP